MSVNLKNGQSNSNSLGNNIKLNTTNLTPKTNRSDVQHEENEDENVTPISITVAELRAIDKQFASTIPNRLSVLQQRIKKKENRLAEIRHELSLKLNEHKELTQVIRSAKVKKTSLIHSVNNINKILKKPGMDIPRSMITRLIFEPDDYITRYNYPRALDTFTTSLYKCSPDAYKLIQETFGNVLPRHSNV